MKKKRLLILPLLFSSLLLNSCVNIKNSNTTGSENISSSLTEREKILNQAEFQSKSFIYDDSTHSIYVSNQGELEQNSYRIEYENNSQKEIGNYLAYANIFDVQTNKLVKRLEAYISIILEDISSIKFESKDVEYDGSEHTITFTGEIPSSMKAVYQNNTRSEVGNQIATAKLVLKSNEQIIIQEYEAELTIYQFKDIHIKELYTDYKYSGYNNQFYFDKGPNGGFVKTYVDGKLQEFEQSVFMHAPSRLRYENLQDRNIQSFSAYFGLNETANTSSSIKARIYVDDVLVKETKVFKKGSDAEFVTIDLTNKNSLYIVYDQIDNNGGDHAILANPTFKVKNQMQNSMLVSDMEFDNVKTVTDSNIIENCKILTPSGSMSNDNVSFTTDFDFENPTKGNYYVEFKYHNPDTNQLITKRVNMTVKNDNYNLSYSYQDFTTRFANSTYYGYWLLDDPFRKMHSAMIDEMIKTDLANASENYVTIKLLENNIKVPDFYTIANRTYKYVYNDEARVFYTYWWQYGLGNGFSYTTENDYIKEIKINKYNRSGEYYNNFSMNQLFNSSENKLKPLFDQIDNSMTEGQISKLINKRMQETITYNNWSYADSMWGGFVTNNAICSGYTNTYKYIAQRFGIKAGYDSGSTTAGFHAWVITKVDGKYYMSDPTWSLVLRGSNDYAEHNRVSQKDYHILPEMSPTRYDESLLDFNLIYVPETVIISQNQGLEDIKATVKSNKQDKAPLTSVTVDNYDDSKVGQQTVTITATNNLGNQVKKQVSVFKYVEEYQTSVFAYSGNGNWSKKDKIYLTDGTKEVEFTENAFYIKTTSQSSFIHQIPPGATYFSVTIGIDKSIRDNVPYGEYANTVYEFYIDNTLIYKTKNFGWKTPYEKVNFKLSEEYQGKTMTVKVKDSSGQGASGYVNPMFLI